MPDTARDAAAIRQRTLDEVQAKAAIREYLLADAESRFAEGRRQGWSLNLLYGLLLHAEGCIARECGCSRAEASRIMAHLRTSITGAPHA